MGLPSPLLMMRISSVSRAARVWLRYCKLLKILVQRNNPLTSLSVREPLTDCTSVRSAKVQLGSQLRQTMAAQDSKAASAMRWPPF